MTQLVWRSPGEEATIRFGVMLGRSLTGPAWIGLCGPLGAGKTRLAAGVARGLGFTGRVRSPSFVLEHRYQGLRPILHLDLYRLEKDDEDLRASWEEEIDAVVLVEWAERVAVPPRGGLSVRLVPDGEAGRLILLNWEAGTSPVGHLRLEALREGTADPEAANPGTGGRSGAGA
jgi:tRNA threonylcarbamoyladenosine biosynthesis protein TsaE